LIGVVGIFELQNIQNNEMISSAASSVVIIRFVPQL